MTSHDLTLTLGVDLRLSFASILFRFQEDPSTARYYTVCDGCPPWDECDNCSVSDSNSDPQCSTALEHTTSDEPGSKLSTLSVDNGYWRATADSATILPCYNTAACLGGQTGVQTFCDDGYMGPCKRAMHAKPVPIKFDFFSA